MIKDINVYVPLDSLFDYKQGLICKLATDETQDLPARLVQAAQLWSTKIQERYRKRNIDDFNYPELGVTHDQFVEAYENRTVEDFVFYTPSNLSSLLAKYILELELEYEQMNDIRSFKVVVNTFPYQLDEDLSNALHDSLTQRFNGNQEVVLMYKDDRTATPSFYRSFTHVFKYDIFLGKAYENFFKYLVTEPIPDVVFFVPDLFKSIEEYITNTPAAVIDGIGLALSNQMGIRAIPHYAYDHL